MSMMKCPECGQEISSMARACPHCGCEISVCPDCGAVHKGKKNTCDSCGCVLQKPEAPVTVSAPNSAGSFEQRAKSYHQVDSIIGIASTVFLLTAVLVAIFAVPNMIKAMTGKSLEVLEMKNKYESVRSVLILCAVMLSLYGGGYLFEVIGQHVFGARIKSAREDYKRFIFDVNVKTTADVLCAIEFAETPDKAKKRYLLPALKFIVDIIGAVLLCVWVVGTVKAFYAEWFLAFDPSGVKMKWNYADIQFILGCALLAVGEIVGFLYKRKEGSDKHLIEIQDTLKN